MTAPRATSGLKQPCRFPATLPASPLQVHAALDIWRVGSVKKSPPLDTICTTVTAPDVETFLTTAWKAGEPAGCDEMIIPAWHCDMTPPNAMEMLVMAFVCTMLVPWK